VWHPPHPAVMNDRLPADAAPAAFVAVPALVCLP
jgi:hypothetical protein